MENKDKFVKAEAEIISFEEDVIITSNQSVIISGPGPMIEEDEENE